jgi:hypothetical protein
VGAPRIHGELLKLGWGDTSALNSNRTVYCGLSFVAHLVREGYGLRQPVFGIVDDEIAMSLSRNPGSHSRHCAPLRVKRHLQSRGNRLRAKGT